MRQALLAVSEVAACDSIVRSEPQMAVLIIENCMDGDLIETGAGDRSELGAVPDVEAVILCSDQYGAIAAR